LAKLHSNQSGIRLDNLIRELEKELENQKLWSLGTDSVNGWKFRLRYNPKQDERQLTKRRECKS